MSIPSMLASQGDSARRLVASGRIIAPLGLLRAQSSSVATHIGTDGSTWATVSADTARFTGLSRRLLVEGQRSNMIRNPRALNLTAGIVGTGAVAPTNWTIASIAGITIEILGATVVNGVSGMAFRLTGTSGAAGSIALDPETMTGIAASPNQTWTASALACSTAGTLTGILGFGVGFTSRTSGGSALSGNGTVVQSLGTALTRYSRTGPTTTDATTACVQPRMSVSIAASTTIDCTIFMGWPQMELGGIASTPVLPPSGVVASSTRSADNVRATLSALGVGAGAACTILWGGVLPQASPAGDDQCLFQIDDGTDANRYRLRNLGGGSSIVAGRVTGGTSLDGTALGTMTAGTGFRAGMTLNGAGRLAACIQGGSVQVVTGGPTSGLTTLRLGLNATLSSAMFGTTTQLRVVPFALSDTALQGAVAAMPA